MQRYLMETIKVLCLCILCYWKYLPNQDKKQKTKNPNKQNKKPPTKTQKKYKSYQCFLYQSNSFALDLPDSEVGVGIGRKEWVGG